MKKLLLIAALLTCLVASAQIDSIVEVTVGEYNTSYIGKSGRVYFTYFGQAPFGVYRDTTGPTKISNGVSGQGSQYRSVILKSDGKPALVYKDVADNSRDGVQNIDVDYLGNAFTGNTKVFGAFKSFLTLRAGVPWIFGYSDFMGVAGTSEDVYYAPRPLSVPSGKTITKLVCMEPVYNPGSGIIMGLVSDGTVILYTKGGGGAYTTVSGLTGVLDITAITQFVYVAITADDIKAWGPYSEMVGLAANTTTPTSIKASFISAGLQFPIKQAVENWTCFLLLDNKNDLFGIGDNVHGNLGIGTQWPNWRTNYYSGTRSPYAWNFNRSQYPQTTAVQIMGKFKKVFGSGNFANHFFAMDMGGAIYSWGRNKDRALGNKLHYENDNIFPEALNVPFPKKVNPLGPEMWPPGFTPNFDSTSILRPQASAGVDQYIQTTSTTLYGQGHQQGTLLVPVGNITSFLWQKVSGPSGGTISSPTQPSTTVTGLVPGQYKYALTVASNVNGQQETAEVLVNVTTNVLPNSDAGPDQTITLPTSAVTLNGSGSDPDGYVTSYTWAQVGGTAATITSPETGVTTVTGLTTPGIRSFRLQVVDNSFGSKFDFVNITVSAGGSNAAPTVNAGSNVTLTLPTNSTTLTAVGADADGTVASYLWTKTSGGVGTISSASSASTSVINLVAGTYTFRVTVTDNLGSTGFDDATVTVNAAPVPGGTAPIRIRGRRFRKAP